MGVDNVDLEAATRAGITVVNAPTGNTIAAAEHTLALLYGVARKIAAADAGAARRVEAGPVHWPRAARPDARDRRAGQDRPGDRGPGPGDGDDIPESPYVTAEQAAHHGVDLVSFDDLLTRSDVVSVHVPLTRATRGLVGRRARPG